MARGKFELDLLRDDSGNAVVVTGATVTVTVEGTGVPADLYDDITGPAGPGNPFTVVGSTIEFFADQENRYRLDITTVGGYSRTLRYRDVTIDVQAALDYADTQIAAHSAEVDDVHGIPIGDAVESVSGSQAKADAVSTLLTTHIADTAPHPNQTIEFGSVTYPAAYKVGDPTHIDTLLETHSHSWSAGVVHGCNITDNLDGTVSIDAGYAVLRDAPDSHVPLYAIETAAQASIALTDNSENYVYYDYNAGSPQWVASTSRDSFNCLDKCIGYYIYRDGTTLNIIDAREQNVDSNRKSRQLFLKFQKFIHAEGGTSLGGSGLALTVTAGEFFYMLESLPHVAFDTTIAGTANENVFSLWYRDGIGGWTETVDSKVIDSTVYDNDTGTPVAISNNKYGVSWVYIVQNEPSSLHVVMGQSDYSTAADAEAASPPATLPGLLGAHASLIGFVVYLKSATSFVSVLSAFTQRFISTAATNHNGLSGLQGGAVDQYYHLTETEHTAYGYHTRTRNTAAPNATIPVHAITATGAETNIDIAFSPKGTGAIISAIPDGTATGGDKRGAYAVDFQRDRLTSDEVASGDYSFLFGRDNKVTATAGGSAGRDNHVTSAAYSFAFGFGIALSGNGSFGTGQYSQDRGLLGSVVQSSDRRSVSGDSQIRKAVLNWETTDSTPAILTSSTLMPSTVAPNIFIIPDNYAYAIIARVIGRDTSTGDVYHVVIEGTAYRGTGAATVALEGAPVYTTISKSAGASGWNAELVVSTVRGSAEIQVTGESGTTIHWVCKFDTVEVG